MKLRCCRAISLLLQNCHFVWLRELVTGRMSRIIVKGLPSSIKEQRLREHFGAMGTITNCDMKYTKDGVFRKFAFIGFSSEEGAQSAVKFFDQTYIDTSKIRVEIASELGDTNKPRAWSKYSKDSSAYKRLNKEALSAAQKKEREKKKKEERERQRQEKLDSLIADIQGDAGFQEFLEVNKVKSTKAFWGNDDVATDAKQKASTSKAEKPETSASDDRRSSDVDEDQYDAGGGEKAGGDAVRSTNEKADLKAKAPPDLSDLDYLRSKMTESGVFSDSDEDSDQSESDGGGDGVGKDKQEISDDDDDDDNDDDGDKDQQGDPENEFRYLIKMKGAPPSVKKNQVTEFFRPIEVVDVKIPVGKGRTSKIVTVEFKSENDLELALRRNKNCLGPKRVYLHKLIERKPVAVKPKPRLWELKANEGEELGDIGDSGRLFVRNLAYCATEDGLEALFEKYGEVSEVHLPIDTSTKKIKGFAYVSFMFPEHAVKAYQELDGKSWMGRILHILPAKEKKGNEVTSIKETTDFKKKKEAEKKASAGSSHNWNTLFLGSNAVVDAMAEQFGAKKSDILGVEGSKDSIGVRLALGETKIVSETRSFLVDNGVSLDAFSQPAAKRSKTVILAKNLPANTTAEELRELFQKYGTLGRLLLPPSGLTAIIEFMEPTEARMAFRGLAYTKFHYLPLYLEWAPTDVFIGPPKAAEPEKWDLGEGKEGDSKTERGEENMDVGETPTQGTKETGASQPGCSVFVKNLNFDTQDESLQKLFSKCGTVVCASVSKKKDVKNPGKMLSMGFGFVEFAKPEAAQKALKTLQHVTLDGHRLELKISHRTTAKQEAVRQKQENKNQPSSKILVRNIPFEAKQSEVQELFSVFGELKSARLPKKMSGTGQHRGFAFVDFLNKEDAKRAFDALCHSTHLYGRRLVLEWAAPDESVDVLRLKTASKFSLTGGSPSKKLKKSTLMNDLDLS